MWERVLEMLGWIIKSTKVGGGVRKRWMAIVTYRSQPMDKQCFRQVKKAVNWRETHPICSPSHPECQCMAIHDWGGGFHQVEYRPQTGPALL